MTGKLVEKYLPLVDVLATPIALIAAVLTVPFARYRPRLPRSRRWFERLSIMPLRHHYYEPTVFESDIWKDLSEERNIPGLNLNSSGQLKLIAEFRYKDELIRIPRLKSDDLSFAYDNGSFESGDAEMLYNMIRYFKPKRFVEIGCGQSTLMARLAEGQNEAESSDTRCRHVCIEPYEQPWLEQLGIEVIREKVERCPKTVFAELEANDILFIDSSHVIRPQGDVTFELLELAGTVRPGVLIHIHDVFTPRDYPSAWIIGEQRLWNEQYLLEAFLSFNSSFEVVSAVNWLAHNHRELLAEACPILCMDPDREPGSFWIRRCR